MRKRMHYVMVIGVLAGLLTGCGDGKTEVAVAEQKVTTEIETTEENEAANEVTTTEKSTTEIVQLKEEKEDKTDEKEAVTTESEGSVKSTAKETTQASVTTEKEKKTTEKKKPKKKTDKKTTEKSTTEKNTTEAAQSNKEIAKGYVGKTLDSLVAAIGSYSSFSKAESCYYEGEYDGIAQFDGFTVYCHSEGQTTWYIDSVE